ncbi:MAG: CRISPR-associated helicase Cas3', partial [Phycisphaerales bacterium]|nr:CRISPR-associated helicase Cas3' [Phycisphaerales bacterium]
SRLVKEIPNYAAAPQHILNLPTPELPAFDWDKNRRRCMFQMSVFCRMLFSCLVDADFLATESFMSPDRASDRVATQWPIADLAARLDGRLQQLTAAAPDTPVTRARAEVLSRCREMATSAPGLFSLTVPTGGGKTFSSLSFALRHAQAHNLRRVIYAIPFTSIIEQNADVFRGVFESLGPYIVLEHHSNLDPDDDTRWGRLAAENWDAPLIVTTNVQLFESLFASRTSQCRKLHRIARSVIILDECQSLPVELLRPTLVMLDELRRNYGCTIVLCTATQPAIELRDGFPIGLSGATEIVSDPPALYASLRRVEAHNIGKLDDDALIERLARHSQVLCVVNTRGHAAKLFGAGPAAGIGDGLFHLSAQMCPAHRSDVLAEIRARLSAQPPLPCRVISTQLIEAGVDIDFPVVYRTMAGLDSITQAAGRCNREGRRERGDVYIFETDEKPRHLRQAPDHTREVAKQHDDLLSLEAMRQYFELMYWSRKLEWDKKDIMPMFAYGSDGLHFQFREAAQAYEWIDAAQHAIVVPYGEIGRNLIDELRQKSKPPGREFRRRLQRYTVTVYPHIFMQLQQNQVIALCHESIWVLANANAYDAHLGLRHDQSGFEPDQLVI